MSALDYIHQLIDEAKAEFAKLFGHADTDVQTVAKQAVEKLDEVKSAVEKDAPQLAHEAETDAADIAHTAETEGVTPAAEEAAHDAETVAGQAIADAETAAAEAVAPEGKSA